LNARDPVAPCAAHVYGCDGLVDEVERQDRKALTRKRWISEVEDRMERFAENADIVMFGPFIPKTSIHMLIQEIQGFIRKTEKKGRFAMWTHAFVATMVFWKEIESHMVVITYGRHLSPVAVVSN
jgi:hypothetical protein